MKQTPGPWVVKKKEDGTYMVVSKHRIFLSENGTYNGRPGAWILDIVNKKDADLIAAAPEMLDALDEAWMEIDVFVSKLKDGYQKDVARETLNKIESAMRSAKGLKPKKIAEETREWNRKAAIVNEQIRKGKK